MKRPVVLLVSYILVFSLLGIGILQYFFLKKQKELLEQQILHSIKSSLGEVELKIKMKEMAKLMPQMDSLGLQLRRQITRQLAWNIFPDTCDENTSTSAALSWHEIADTAFSSDFEPDGKSPVNSLASRLLVEYTYQSLRKILNSKSLSERISVKELKQIIDEEFQKKNINVPYEFAVYHNGSETRVRTPGFKIDENRLIIRYPILDDNAGGSRYELLISISRKDIYRDKILFFQILSYVLTAFLLFSFLVTVYNMMRQRHLTELKNDFINNITHEFKTPIATMALAIDSIKSPGIINDPEKIKHYLKILKKENQRMLQQVEKILFLSKLEQGKIIWKNKVVNVHEVIYEALNHMQLIFKSKDAKIHLDLEAAHPYIEADPIFLFDALINLLDNAVKYSTDNVEITIRTYNKNNYLVIEIADKGVGMSKDISEHIFEKFYRKPTGDIHNVPGHGIGLTFVKQVVEKMKGEIFVDSQPGKGTVFTIYIPVARTRENPNEPEETNR